MFNFLSSSFETFYRETRVRIKNLNSVPSRIKVGTHGRQREKNDEIVPCIKLNSLDDINNEFFFFKFSIVSLFLSLPLNFLAPASPHVPSSLYMSLYVLGEINK